MNFQSKAKSDHHRTPQRVFDFIESIFNEDVTKWFDPCPFHSKFDGLNIKWKPYNYVNAPYSRLFEFVMKATDEFFINGNKSLMLLPVQSDQLWWNDFICGFKFKITWIPFRVRFVGQDKPSLNTHCLVVTG